MADNGPEIYDVTIEQIERELGFRIGPRGLELLEFSEDATVPARVKAVNPVVSTEQGRRVWNMIEQLLQTIVLRNRDVRYWKDKGFAEHERSLGLQSQLDEIDRRITDNLKEKQAAKVRGVDAHSVKDGLGSPIDKAQSYTINVHDGDS